MKTNAHAQSQAYSIRTDWLTQAWEWLATICHIRATCLCRCTVCLKLRKNDIICFPVALPERPAWPERWSPRLRLILVFAANYFMPSFELSDEIQLSGSLCSLQDWGGDEGRNWRAERETGTGETLSACEIWRTSQRNPLYKMLLNACLLWNGDCASFCFSNYQIKAKGFKQ